MKLQQRPRYSSIYIKNANRYNLGTPDVHVPFKSIIDITELIGNNNEDFKTDKRTNGKNTNDNYIVRTNINDKINNKNSKENQNCDS